MLNFADIANVRKNPANLKFIFFMLCKAIVKNKIGTKSLNPKKYVGIITIGDNQYIINKSLCLLGTSLSTTSRKKQSIVNNESP